MAQSNLQKIGNNQMAIKGRKFSKQHLANLRAAHAKRRGKKRKNLVITATNDRFKIGDSVNFDENILKGRSKRLMQIQPVVDYDPVSYSKTNGLIERMTQAIDKIKEQIERLETL